MTESICALLLLLFPTTAAASSCSILKCNDTTWQSYINETICAARNTAPLSGPVSGCSAEGVVYAEALAHCEAAGARLCTYAELYSGAGKSLGCSFDGNFIWTADRCKLNNDLDLGYLITQGDGGYCSKCVSPDTTSLDNFGIQEANTGDPINCAFTPNYAQDTGTTCCADFEDYCTFAPTVVPTKPTFIPSPPPTLTPIIPPTTRRARASRERERERERGREREMHINTQSTSERKRENTNNFPSCHAAAPSLLLAFGLHVLLTPYYQPPTTTLFIFNPGPPSPYFSPFGSLFSPSVFCPAAFVSAPRA